MLIHELLAQPRHPLGRQMMSCKQSHACRGLSEFDLTPKPMLVTQVLHWTRDWGRAQELAWRVAVLYAELFQQLQDATLGVAQWLAALRKANTPCALVSHMPAAHVKVREYDASGLPRACHPQNFTPALLHLCAQYWHHTQPYPSMVTPAGLPHMMCPVIHYWGVAARFNAARMRWSCHKCTSRFSTGCFGAYGAGASFFRSRYGRGRHGHAGGAAAERVAEAAAAAGPLRRVRRLAQRCHGRPQLYHEGAITLPVQLHRPLPHR